ncbi:MAG: hypothetical protein J5648_07370 [Lachnospiraceae bacterium]|nr:hypothetical protein [Lachnospiraceae bacterium]
MDLKRLKQNLSDAGCCKNTSDDIIRMCEAGNMKGALHMMRKDRCRLMDELHESGRKVDCLDYLIRTTENALKMSQVHT